MPFPVNPDLATTPQQHSGPSLFQLPQFYWNHLTNIDPSGVEAVPSAPVWAWQPTPTSEKSDGPASAGGWAAMHASGGSANGTDGTGPGTGNGNGNGTTNSNNNDVTGTPPIQQLNVPTVTEPDGFPITGEWQGHGAFMSQSAGAADQAAIYAALMSYMVEATKAS
jgi:hypothetical protein